MDKKDRDFDFSPLGGEKKDDIEQKIREVKKRRRSSFDLLPPKEKILKEYKPLEKEPPKNVNVAKKVKEKIEKRVTVNSEDVRKKIEQTHHELFPDVDINIERELSVTPTSSPVGNIEIPEKEEVKPISSLKKESLEIKNNSYVRPKGLADKLTKVDTHKVKEIVESVDREIEGKIIFISRFLSGLFDFFIVGILSLTFYYLASTLTGADIINDDFFYYFTLLFLTNFLFYSVIFLFTVRQTPGMMIGGVKLISDKKLNILNFLLRELIFLFSIAFLCLGLIWGLFSKKNQCWHDIIVDSYVVRDR